MNQWGLSGTEARFLQEAGSKEEGFPLYRWSTIKLVKNVLVPATLNFFQDTFGGTGGLTKWHTNMRDAGKLERPYRAVFKRMWMQVLPSDPAMFTSASDAAIMQDTKRLHELFAIETGIIDKDYTEYPGSLVPSGAGPVGILASTGTAAAPDYSGTIGWGTPAISNFCGISILVPTQTRFRVDLINQHPVAMTLNSVSDMYVRVIIAGPCVRQVQ